MSRGAPARAPPVIAVVDDDPFVLRLLSDTLRSKGYLVAEMDSGREVLRRMCTGDVRPRLVIADLVMPDMDGRTLLALMRVNPASARVPVLIVTGTVCDGLERELEREGAEAVIAKSWGTELIVEYVETLLDRRAA